MSTEIIKYTRLISKDEEKKYLRFAFDVPDNVDMLTVRYKYNKFADIPDGTGGTYKKAVNTIDIGVSDSNEVFRGWSGSSHSSFSIREGTASPGYVAGEVTKGLWNVILGAYRVDEQGCEVELTVEFEYKSLVLLKGDLHIHSNHSDGKNSAEEIIQISKAMKLDFICLSDHNTCSGHDYIQTDEELTVIPGVEMTHYNGHCNFFGVRRPVRNYLGNSKDEVIEIMRAAKQSGALISLNHPFCKDNGWGFGFDVDYDIIEIQNAFFDEEEDIKAINWWHEQLCLGKRIPIVGGSDSHGARFMQSIALPATFVYSMSRGKSDILKAIAGGRSFVSSYIDGPIMEMNMSGYIMGDIVPNGEIESLHVKAGRLMPYDEIIIISDKGIIKSVEINNQSSIEMEIDAEEYKFIRAEIWRYVRKDVKILTCITNPIYFGG